VYTHDVRMRTAAVTIAASWQCCRKPRNKWQAVSERR
jgi:hypothetical protein